jgi:hypothetical protein
MRSIYSPGHAPGHVRNAFLEALEAFARWGDAEHPCDAGLDEPVTLRTLCGALWNCGDILPGGDCDMIDLPRGSTYAQAARHIRSQLTA